MWFWRQNREISEEVLVIKYINNVICLDSVALVDAIDIDGLGIHSGCRIDRTCLWIRNEGGIKERIQ